MVASKSRVALFAISGLHTHRGATLRARARCRALCPSSMLRRSPTTAFVVPRLSSVIFQCYLRLRCVCATFRGG
ncbi:hypothetical protein PR001_g26761 [Phytophthora rubi]|uniref:Uncharacterized protein n=1 Tax=Phytophthora rubi TaxID=129364 RepID=A0A6A3HUG1_9STRA|nr:hypothetical protein PR001_g26761 [Phytophthora rubi]